FSKHQGLDDAYLEIRRNCRRKGFDSWQGNEIDFGKSLFKRALPRGTPRQRFIVAVPIANSAHQNGRFGAATNADLSLELLVTNPGPRGSHIVAILFGLLPPLLEIVAQFHDPESRSLNGFVDSSLDAAVGSFQTQPAHLDGTSRGLCCLGCSISP